MDSSDPKNADAAGVAEKEIQFYLMEIGGDDPWAYARYHCSTASNLYSTVHWSFFGDKGDRLGDLVRFYSILDTLQKNIGGARKLADCSGRMMWPKRGVYFFQEPGEQRSDSGDGPRVVRVGTHALREEVNTRLWTRLSQHKGKRDTGGGSHRSSVFRLIVGSSLIRKHSLDEYPCWGDKKAAYKDERVREQPLEQEVSKVIGNMPFLWVAIDGEVGSAKLRSDIERNSVALLSNYKKNPSLDPPSQSWLGQHCAREKISKSGLWNSDYVEKTYDPCFLDDFDRLVSEVSDAA